MAVLDHPDEEPAGGLLVRGTLVVPAVRLRAVGRGVVLAQLEVAGLELTLGLGLWHSVDCWCSGGFLFLFQFQF